MKNKITGIINNNVINSKINSIKSPTGTNQEKNRTIIKNKSEVLTKFLPYQVKQLKIRENETPIDYLERLYCILIMLNKLKSWELSNVKSKQIGELKKEYLLAIDLINAYTINLFYDIKRARENLSYNETITDIDMINFINSIGIKTIIYSKLKYSIYHFTTLLKKTKPENQNVIARWSNLIKINTDYNSITDTKINKSDFYNIKNTQLQNINSKELKINNIKDIINKKSNLNYTEKIIIIKKQIKDTYQFRNYMNLFFEKLEPEEYNILIEILSIENIIYNITNKIFENFLNNYQKNDNILTQLFNIQQINYTYIINFLIN